MFVFPFLTEKPLHPWATLSALRGGSGTYTWPISATPGLWLQVGPVECLQVLVILAVEVVAGCKLGDARGLGMK